MPPPEPRAQWLLPAAVIAAGALSCAAVAVFLLLRPVEGRPEIEAVRGAASVAAEDEGDPGEPTEALGSDDDDDALPTAVLRELPTSMRKATAPEAGSDPTAAVATEGEAPGEAPGERPKPSQEPTQREVMNALRRTRITLYTTQWCPVCTEARRWMQHNNVPFVEQDIDASDSAKRAMRERNPKGSVPTIDIDGEILIGFSEARVSRVIARKVERRLGLPPR